MTGRPPLTDEQKNDLVRKLEPYLEAGLSIRKACFQAGVPKSTVYDYLSSDEDFSDRIQRIGQSVSVKLAMIVSNQLTKITSKQSEGVDLTTEDINFIKWFAVSSTATRDEFSKRQEIVSDFDPEQEIQRVKRIIDEALGRE